MHKYATVYLVTIIIPEPKYIKKKKKIFATTVKPVFKGHCDEGTPCDQGTLSQNDVISSTCLRTCDEGTPVM